MPKTDQVKMSGSWDTFSFSLLFFHPLWCQGNTLVWISVDLDRGDRWVTRVSCMKKSEQGSFPVCQKTG